MELCNSSDRFTRFKNKTEPWVVPIIKRYFFKMGHSQPLFLNFHLFYFNVQLVDKILPMLGFKLPISGVGSDYSINWVTTTAQWKDTLIFISKGKPTSISEAQNRKTHFFGKSFNFNFSGEISKTETEWRHRSVWTKDSGLKVSVSLSQIFSPNLTSLFAFAHRWRG